MSLPNALTVVRIVMAPVFVGMVLASGAGAGAASSPLSVAAGLVFAAASFTDFLDGAIARRRGTVSSFGKLMDPVADKALVLSAVAVLVATRGFPLWAAGVIAVREAAVSLWRVRALRAGRVLAAGNAGKVKTLLQIPMVIIWTLPRTGSTAAFQDASIVAAVAATVLSAVIYFAGGRSPEPARPGTAGETLPGS